MIDSQVKEIGYSIKNDQDADYVINNLKSQLNYYKQKNLQYNNIFTNIKLTPNNLDFETCEILNKFVKLQEKSGIDKFDLIDSQMSYLIFASAKCNYDNKLDTLKLKHEVLQQMSIDVCKELQTIEREINYAKISQEQLYPVSQNNFQKVKLQIETYEKKLLKFIDKYPWLNEPEYNLLSIQEEIKKIYQLQEEMNKLEKQTECYDDLKPDLFSAKNQLSKIKVEYDNICKMVKDND